MAPRSILILLLVVGLFSGAEGAIASRQANTASVCSLLEEPDPRKRLDGKLDHRIVLSVVATVLEEAPIETQLRTPPGTDAEFVITPLDPASVDPEWSNFQATVQVEAVLKGKLPAPELVLPFLSDGWQCGGGPRLAVGSRVLLLLTEEPTWTSNGEPRDVIWGTGPVSGTIRFDGDKALLEDYQSNLGKDLGRAEDVLRYVADRVGAPDDATAEALRTLSLTQPPLRQHEELFQSIPSRIVSVLVALLAWSGLRGN